MISFDETSGPRKVTGWFFLATGVFSFLGVVFGANGAKLEVGIFNTLVGAALLSIRLRLRK